MLDSELEEEIATWWEDLQPSKRVRENLPHPNPDRFTRNADDEWAMLTVGGRQGIVMLVVAMLIWGRGLHAQYGAEWMKIARYRNWAAVADDMAWVFDRVLKGRYVDLCWLNP